MKDAAQHSIELGGLLRSLQVEDALEKVRLIRSQQGDKTTSSVLCMASDTESAGMLAYTLIVMLLVEKEDVLWHRIARDILSNTLCHYSYAEAASLVHARRACALEPDNVRNWVLLIDIGTNRTQLLSDDKEISDAAAQILRLDPGNKWGQAYMK